MGSSVVTIIVPVLGRPHRAAPLAENITHATPQPFDLIFVCSPEDGAEIDACQQVSDTMVVDKEAGHGDYAFKTNYAFQRTSAPWIFTAADDLRFHEGWLDAALRYADEACVIGTNDMHNPVVKRGDHSTHTLIRRAYVDGPGASFDGPGIVYSEAYDHQYVDTELVWLAKRRDVWAHAADSLVEHLHPFWHGRRGMDATYEKGLARGREDARLFEQRKAVYLSA